MASNLARHSRPNVLIVEDNLDHAELISRSLRKFEVRVTVVHTGQAGWEQLQSCHINLLILDYGLPDVDGLALLKKLRQKDEQMPVIMLTAHRDRWLTEQACRYGANYFIIKTAENAYLRRVEEIVTRELGLAPKTKPPTMNFLLCEKRRYNEVQALPWAAALLKNCMN